MAKQHRLEAHMISPILALMREDMGLDLIAHEFSAGYGRADLIGATLSHQGVSKREQDGLKIPFDRYQFIEPILILQSGIRRSLRYILSKVSYAESTLRRNVLPTLIRLGVVKKFPDDYYQLVKSIANPTGEIVAIEAKQTDWKRAIVQARRYGFFANKSYIALWEDVIPRVDRLFLYQMRLGLISVQPETAHIVVNAPPRNPRSLAMHTLCAEFLFRVLLSGDYIP